MDEWPLSKDECSIVDHFMKEQLFDKSHVLKSKAVNWMKLYFKTRDKDAWPLQDNELKLLDLMVETKLVDENNVFTSNEYSQ